jgi:hypothetical protein
MAIAAIKDYKQVLDEDLHSDLNPWKPMFDQIDKLTRKKLPRIFIFIGVVSLVCMYLLFGLACDMLCWWVGIIYPLAKTVQALSAGNSVEMKRWLIYWLVFSLMPSFELIFEPGNFYWAGKCFMQILLALPKADAILVLIYEGYKKTTSKLLAKFKK